MLLICFRNLDVLKSFQFSRIFVRFIVYNTGMKISRHSPLTNDNRECDTTGVRDYG